MNGIVVLRVFVVALGLLLAGVLIARGNVVIGVIVGVLALARLALFVTVLRRRKVFRNRFPGRWDRPR